MGTVAHMRASPTPPIPPGILIVDLNHRKPPPTLPWLARVRDTRKRRYKNKCKATYPELLANI